MVLRFKPSRKKYHDYIDVETGKHYGTDSDSLREMAKIINQLSLEYEPVYDFKDAVNRAEDMRDLRNIVESMLENFLHKKYRNTNDLNGVLYTCSGMIIIYFNRENIHRETCEEIIEDVLKVPYRERVFCVDEDCFSFILNAKYYEIECVDNKKMIGGNNDG